MLHINKGLKEKYKTIDKCIQLATEKKLFPHNIVEELKRDPSILNENYFTLIINPDEVELQSGVLIFFLVKYNAVQSLKILLDEFKFEVRPDHVWTCLRLKSSITGAFNFENGEDGDYHNYNFNDYCKAHGVDLESLYEIEIPTNMKKDNNPLLLNIGKKTMEKLVLRALYMICDDRDISYDTNWTKDALIDYIMKWKKSAKHASDLEKMKKNGIEKSVPKRKAGDMANSDIKPNVKTKKRRIGEENHSVPTIEEVSDDDTGIVSTPYIPLYIRQKANESSKAVSLSDRIVVIQKMISNIPTPINTDINYTAVAFTRVFLSKLYNDPNYLIEQSFFFEDASATIGDMKFKSGQSIVEALRTYYENQVTFHPNIISGQPLDNSSYQTDIQGDLNLQEDNIGNFTCCVTLQKVLSGSFCVKTMIFDAAWKE